MNLKPVVATVVLAIGLAPGATASPFTEIFSSLFIFGDSLSDSGDTDRLAAFPTPLSEPSNTFQTTFAVTEGLIGTGIGYPPAPYFNGRFSNGPVWADGLIADFDGVGKTARNYAFGGAQAVNDTTVPIDIPDLAAQVLRFGADGAADAGDRPLAALFFGGNDLFDAFNDGDDPLAEAGAAASAMGNAMRSIGAIGGVRDFVYFTLGDIGMTPRFNPLLNPAVDATVQGLATLATATFNSALRAEAADLRAEGYKMIEVDAAARIAQILADPSLLGLSDAVFPCGVPAGSVPVLGLTTYDFSGCDLADVGNVFFDDVHPSAAVHGELARLTRSSIAAAIPLPMPLALLGGAILALGGLGLRRRV